MALIYRATLTPSKPGMLEAWVPTQPWAAGVVVTEIVGAYRFDDPDGQVGVETHLVRTDDGLLRQVPLTYRPAPLEGAEAFHVTTAEHSVLGRRWVYDGCADPVYAAALATAIRTGATQAETWVHHDEGPERRSDTMQVLGSGAAGAEALAVATVAVATDTRISTITASGVELVVLRVLDGSVPDQPSAGTLTGTWTGHTEPAVLAYVARGRASGVESAEW